MAYEYDLLGRLSKDGSPESSSWLYDYDAVGNRLSEQRDNATALTDYDYEANSNRMSQINTTAITLDPAGNTLDDGFRQYQYNAMNRLAQVNTTQNGLQANYIYNFMGQRVRKVISGSQSSDSRYFYGPQGELMGEYDALGNRVYEYIYRPDTEYPELIAVVNATGDILHVHTDHLMTPRQVTDSSQTVVWQWLSEAFGQTLANEDPDGDSQTVTLNHRFSGQHYDKESGLHYNYFRYYNPGTGRYITSDPIGLAGGINTYLHVLNNPLMYIDIYGLTQTCYRPLRILPFAVIGTKTDENLNSVIGHQHIFFDDGTDIGFGGDGIFSGEDINEYSQCKDIEAEKDEVMEQVNRYIGSFEAEDYKFHPKSFGGNNCQDFVDTIIDGLQ